MKALILGLIVVLILLIGGIVAIQVVSVNSTNSDNGTEENNNDNKEEVETKKTEVTEEDLKTNPIATIKIEGMEEMQFVLFPDRAPQSVFNFISLANSGFYDGLTMHRIVTDFVAQGGDEEGTGAGPTDYTIKGEFPSNDVETGLTHQKGALAWARSALPDSAGTQFYICLDDVSYLDPNYAVFGYMISGEEALDQLQAVSSESGTPTQDVIIESVSVDTQGVVYPEPDKL